MKEINPKQTKRAQAFELWMNAPMPMVTVFKTLDVTNLLRVSRKSGFKFNALLCHAIGKAASQIEEFYLLPMQGKLFQFEHIAINVIINKKGGGINNCDVPFCPDFSVFYEDYLRLTKQASETDAPCLCGDEYTIIGTSAVTSTQLDGIVNLYSGLYNNPFLSWSRYKKGIFKTTLALSFQFHHTQMDGKEAATFLELLQSEINNLKI